MSDISCPKYMAFISVGYVSILYEYQCICLGDVETQY